MPRKARVALPDHPHHIAQRGHNRQAVFLETRDYWHYLVNLRRLKARLGVKVFACRLMTNHVHLAVDPGANAGNLALLMRRLAGRQTRCANKLGARSGALWESRYQSSPIESERCLPCCSRYVECNPVRAGMVSRPEAYQWSSVHSRMAPGVGWLDLDPAFAGLGDTAAGRARAYRAFVDEAPGSGAVEVIRSAARAVDRDPTIPRDDVARRIGLRVESRGRGRPSHHPRLELGK